MKRASRLIVWLVVGLTIGLTFYFDAHRYLTFAELKAHQADLLALYEMHSVWFLTAFFTTYVIITALSLPGATAMTLAAGALFGVKVGFVVVSFASSLGATLAMLTARFLLRDSVERNFRERLKQINAGLAREGGFYLFTLRLIPLIPFFAINLAMGVTQFSTWRFYLISQIGMIPGTLAYVNAGTRLAELDSAAGILSPAFLLSFAALGILPLMLKRFVDRLRASRVYRGWRRPKRFDYNLVVLGGGSGGLISAYIAAAVKARVALIEADKMGGDCLNRGCVPSKALIRAAKVAHEVRHANQFGIQTSAPAVDFKAVMKRVHQTIDYIAPNDSMERYRSLGVECFAGFGKVLSPWEVEVNGRVLTTQNIVIATGAKPLLPTLSGLDAIKPLHSDNLWELESLPKQLIVLGGGAVGCELAQSFARLGSQVTIVERNSRLLHLEEPEASKQIEQSFANDGLTVLTGWSAERFELSNGQKIVHLVNSASEVRRIEGDQVLVALGRKANTSGFGLEKLGIDLNERGQIVVDEYMRTKYPNIFAVGDVTGPYLFTHASSHQAWHAAVNGLFGRFKRFKVDYSNLPWCTYTDPEVAHLGILEQDAKQQNIPHQVYIYDLSHLDRAVTDGTNRGFVKLILEPKKGRILGATVCGPHAGEILSELVVAKRNGLTMNAIMSTIHAYPTLTEANKLAAGVWKKQTAPVGLLNWLERYHSWVRG